MILVQYLGTPNITRIIIHGRDSIDTTKIDSHVMFYTRLYLIKFLLPTLIKFT